jgi:ferredoxin
VVTLEILGGPLGPAVRGAVTGRLLDACDALGAPVGFSCRSARCCTCRVDVLAGAALLDPPGDDERELLLLHRSTPGQRLACQVTLRPGPGLLRLRWVGARPPGDPPGE